MVFIDSFPLRLEASRGMEPLDAAGWPGRSRQLSIRSPPWHVQGRVGRCVRQDPEGYHGSRYTLYVLAVSLLRAE